jgi:Tetracyclin repressor-like, C-terminal domain
MATALITTFLDAKMKDAKASVARYSVRSDVDTGRIVQHMGVGSNKAIAGMLATAREPLSRDPQLVASMLQISLAGVSRRLLESNSVESNAPEKQFGTFRRELIFSVKAYLKACSAPTTSSTFRQ